MNQSKKYLFHNFFSHIYVEEKALKYKKTHEILNKFSKSKVVKINHYKDIFSRTNQDFNIQKQSPKIILAVKEDKLIYNGADVCEDFGNKYFYYTSTMMNCIYNCEYCYLKGMYTSANIVIFVNIEDIFNEIENILKLHSMYLCISYDTDILAFEPILHYARKWINFASKHDNLKIELRTKSSNFKFIQDMTVNKNIILAWTLSPDEIINKFEKRTPSLKDRIKSINLAISSGWNVRLCFDPILYTKDWEIIYKQFIDYVFSNVDSKFVYDVSIGVFRVSKEYLKKMRKENKNSVIINYPFETLNGVCSYGKELTNTMVNYIYNCTSKYMPLNKIFI